MGLGGTWGHPLGDLKLMCWLVLCRIRAGFVRGSPRARTNRTWWRVLMRCCDAWVALLGGGGWIGWPL